MKVSIPIVESDGTIDETAERAFMETLKTRYPILSIVTLSSTRLERDGGHERSVPLEHTSLYHIFLNRYHNVDIVTLCREIEKEPLVVYAQPNYVYSLAGKGNKKSFSPSSKQIPH